MIHSTCNGCGEFICDYCETKHLNAYSDHECDVTCCGHRSSDEELTDNDSI